MAGWSDFPIVQEASPWDAFPIVQEADTGQGYVSSLANSAGRGFARVLADVPGGLGYLTGSDTLVQMGDDIEGGINDFFPVNPIYADDFAMKAAGAVGQAGSMLATAGVGGAIGKGFGAVRLGMEAGALGSGFLAGARGGGQDAERYGMEGMDAYGRILAGGAIEVATEKFLFGLGAETRAMRRMLGETVEGGAGRFAKDVLTEGGEEWVAEVGNNAANRLMAPAGVETPGLFHGGLEAFGLGMVGGATFGGFHALVGRGQPMPAEAESTPGERQRGGWAGQTFNTEIAGQRFYYDGLRWTVPTELGQVDAMANRAEPFTPLNPADLVQGHLIAVLEGQRKAALRRGESRPENGFPARGTGESRALWAWVDAEQAAGREVPGMTEYTQEQHAGSYHSAGALAAESKILEAFRGRNERQAGTRRANAPRDAAAGGQRVPGEAREGMNADTVDAANPGLRVGDAVNYEGYEGWLVQDGERLAIEMEDGTWVEVAEADALKLAPVQKPRPLGVMPDPVMGEAAFTAAGDGSLAIEDEAGRIFVPHNARLLRNVRPLAGGGVEVLVRQAGAPGRIIRLTGAQAQNAQDAFLQAAERIEEAGGKVNWGTPSAGFKIDRATLEDQTPSDENAFRHLQFRTRADSELSDAERAALDHIRRSEGDSTIIAKGPFLEAGSAEGNASGRAGAPLPGNRSVQSVGRGNTAQAFLHALEQVFGKKILFVDRTGGELSFNGASVRSARNVLVLDFLSRAPMMYLTGHELVHALKAQRPDLWNEMRVGLLALAGDWQNYREHLAEMQYENAEMVDEFLGDFVGGEFRNPEFWRQAAEAHPKVFSKLAGAVLDFLNNILKKLSRYGREVDHYFQDLTAARAVVMDALGKHAEGGVFPERVLEEGDDADLVRAARVDKPRRGPNLLRANLSPQQPGSNAAVDAFRRSLQAVQSEVQGLGAQIEEIDSAEAARRGYPASLTIAVTPDGKKLVFVTDKLVGQSLPQAVADAVVREEVIHLAWLAAMRAEYQQSGGYMPFEDWLEMELTGWVNELAASAAGEQMLLDAANLYDQPEMPYARVADALQGFAGRETLLIHELARQLVQMRESGEVTESVIAKAINKVRQWFTAALQRLKAMATNVASVSPTLEAALAETERILKGLGGALPGPGPSGTTSLPPIPASLPADPFAFSQSAAINAGDGNLRARPTISEDLYDQSAEAAFERRVRERQGALRAELSETGVEVTEALQTQERRAAVTITDRGDLKLAIRGDLTRSIFHESRGSTRLAERIVEATLGEERLHVATLSVWREDWVQAGWRGSFRDYVRSRAVSLLSDMRGSIEKLPRNLQDQSRQAVFLAWQAYYDPEGGRADVTPRNILEKLSDFVEVERIAQTPGSFVLELTRQLMQVKADGVTTETVFDSIVAPLLELGRRVLAHLRKALEFAEGGWWGEVLRDLMVRTEAVLASGAAPFQPQGQRGGTEGFGSREGGVDLASQRMSEAVGELRGRPKPHLATRDY